eukprot:7384388-Prymnesium_polylepis.1
MVVAVTCSKKYLSSMQRHAASASRSSRRTAQAGRGSCGACELGIACALTERALLTTNRNAAARHPLHRECRR